MFTLSELLTLALVLVLFVLMVVTLVVAILRRAKPTRRKTYIAPSRGVK